MNNEIMKSFPSLSEVLFIIFLIVFCPNLFGQISGSHDYNLLVKLFEIPGNDEGNIQKRKIKTVEKNTFTSDTTLWFNSTFSGKVHPVLPIRSRVILQSCELEILPEIEIDSSLYLQVRNQSWGDSLPEGFIDTASFETMEMAAQKYAIIEEYDSMKNRIYIQMLNSTSKNKRSYLVKTRCDVFLLSIKLKRKNRAKVIANPDFIFRIFLKSFFNVKSVDEGTNIKYSILPKW